MLKTKNIFKAILLTLFFASACQASTQPAKTPKVPPDLSKIPVGMSVALFAGGCFWCMEAPFDKIPGVISTTSGYTDGFVANPAYRKVANGVTGHTEAIQIVFDPKTVSYEKLLTVFWRNIDPGAKDRQFCDRGTQYRSGIYAYDQQQLAAARNSLRQLKSDGVITGKVFTEIKAATRFYRAEEYHQDFYKKNPAHYIRYRTGCGRDARLREIWGRSAPQKVGH